MKKIIRTILLSVWFQNLASTTFIFLKPLKFSKVSKTTNKQGVVLLVTNKDIYLGILALYSFYFFSKEEFPCMIIVKGKVHSSALNICRRLFPNIEITNTVDTGKKVKKLLAGFPRCLFHRSQDIVNNMNIKLFDVALGSPFENILFFDPDILFFKKPKELLSIILQKQRVSAFALQNDYENFYVDGADKHYTVIARMLHLIFNSRVPYRFNSGLMYFHRSIFNLVLVEDLLNYFYEVGLENTWAAEQFLYAFLLSQKKNYQLGSKYRHIRTSNEAQELLHKFYSFDFIHFSYKSKPYYFIAAFSWLKTYIEETSS